MKQSKAAKIRVLLAEGESVQDIAKKLKVKTDYVHQVRWHWKKDAKQKTEKKAKVQKAASKLFDKEYVKYKAKNRYEIKEAALPVPVEDDEAEDFSDWILSRIDLINKEREEKGDTLLWFDPAASKDHDQAKDQVNHPDHYTTGGIETIDFIEAKQLGYHLGNVIKYVSRAPYKGRELEDLKKARWYLDREIDRVQADVYADGWEE
jgi:hypothetical protein